MPTKTLQIPSDSDTHKTIVRRLESLLKMSARCKTDKYDKWRKAENDVLAYVPETEADATRRVERDNQGKVSYSTLKIPYSHALLMAAHTYWTSVFFARRPIHQFASNHGGGENQVQALEAMMQYQVDVGEMLAPYYIWLYDAGKYGVGIIGEYWTRESCYYSEIVDGVDGPELVENHTQGYQGNKSYNVSPYEWYPDPRVTVGEFQRGEFVGVYRQLNWTEILKLAADGAVMNFKEISIEHNKRQLVEGSDETSQLKRPEREMESWTHEGMFTGDIKHPALVHAYEVQVELVPREWGLGSSPNPQKWVFLLANNCRLLIQARPLGAIHGKFTYSVIEPEVEAYGQWNRGIPEIIEPIQNTMDWLLNSHFYNVRTSLNNMFAADPTRVVMKDLQNMREGGIVRIKPEGYGQDLRQMLMQIPVQDVTKQNVEDMSVMLQIGERITGINDQILGVLAGGGRKTATEVRTSTGFGVNRLKTMTEYMSSIGVSQHAMKLVMNSQQYYDGEMKFRIVGDTAGVMGQEFTEPVTAETIKGSYTAVPVDGTLPVDRLAQVALWKDLFGVMRNLPQIGMQYDLAKIFGWVGQLAGLKNIEQFKIQVVPDAQLAAQAQAGNLVPLTNKESDTRSTGYQQPGVPQTSIAG